MRVFMYGWNLAEAIESWEESHENVRTEEFGRISSMAKAKIVGYDLRRFMGNYHIVRGHRVVYGVVARAEKHPGRGWREISVNGISENGKFKAKAYLPLFYLPFDMKVAAYLMKFNGFFMGGDHEFHEYLETILSARPLGTESISEESQYII